MKVNCAVSTRGGATSALRSYIRPERETETRKRDIACSLHRRRRSSLDAACFRGFENDSYDEGRNASALCDAVVNIAAKNAVSFVFAFRD